MKEELSNCLQLFRTRRDLYRKVDLNVAALKYEKSWYNIRTKILLLARESPATSERVIDVGDFVIIHKMLDSAEFATLLENINADNMQIDGLSIRYFANHEIPSLRLHDHCQRDSLRSKEEWDIEWPLDWYQWDKTHKLHNELANIFKEIDVKLCCVDPPYKDVEDAVTSIIKMPKYYFQQDYCRESKCSILLPNFATIKHATLKGDEFAITVRFHESINMEDLLLSVIGYGRGKVRFKEDLEGGEVKRSPPFVQVSKSFKITDVADIQLYLISKPQMETYGHCDQRLVRNIKSTLNPCIALHEVFDEGSETLLDRLRGAPPRRFEHSVATLLHVCGFGTEWLDYDGMVEDAPDILAFCSEPEMVVIGECTTKIPDPNKYKSLKDRAERLKTQLKMDVCPVMFTPIKGSGPVLEEASKQNVSLVTKEKLKKLHDMATRAKDIRDMLYTLTGRNW